MNLIVFDTPDQLKAILGKIGITLDPVGRLLDPNGKALACASCEKDIAVKDVGHILPGSYYVYCRDPVCVLDYLERFE